MERWRERKKEMREREREKRLCVRISLVITDAYT